MIKYVIKFIIVIRFIMQCQSANPISENEFNVDTFLATLTDAERRRLTSAVKIISEWLLSRKTKNAIVRPK